MRRGRTRLRTGRRFQPARAVALAAAWAAALVLCLSGPAMAQTRPGTEPAEAEAPGAVRPRPEYRDLERIRFVTESDYPPFNYFDEEGTLTGFNVDLARALCDELSVECDIRPLDWAALLPALEDGDADAIIASIRVSEKMLEKVDFTDAYYHTPARFAAKKDTPAQTVTPEGLEKVRVGVVKDTAHEAFLRDFFPKSEIVAFEDAGEARRALQEGGVTLLFGDGISLTFWLNGTLSNGCCEFRGGPYTEARYFGEGVGIAVRKGDRKLEEVLNYGLERVRAGGRFEELFLRYFPLSFF